ncbi:phosphatase PAP2 family protein [Brevundimonas sp.]|jgi:membrane-associated PAP2 superfamily phosphatase|uniref:phosphatase PAP2 family protein n=1 Tax=Brevundimonas sp. TaxID=1871086 RepID=UPI002E0F9349|nr:phosphatase PAP2 family protein [Brevundimonas sp.]
MTAGHPDFVAAPAWVDRSRRALRRAGARARLAIAAGARVEEPAVLALAATLLLTVYFLIAPGVDVAVSEAFHRVGEGFPLAQEPALRALRKSSTWVMGLALLGVLIALGCRVGQGRPFTSRTARKAWFLLAGLALGPGLLVNGTLKALWGRPRPVHLEAFGGDAPYVPVWRVTDWCDANCSFVSGEAASAAWTAAAVVMLPPAIRRWAVGPAVAYGAALSLNRLAFGGHFLSDVLLSWSLTALVLGVLWRVMVEAPEPARRRILERHAARAGAAA